MTSLLTKLAAIERIKSLQKPGEKGHTAPPELPAHIRSPPGEAVEQD